MEPFRRLTGMKILLVENDPLLRDALHKALEISGCLVRAVAAAEDGLHVLGLDRFRVVLCDFELPGINGLEFFRQISPATPESVKILITAYGDVDPLSQIYESGIHDAVQKPFAFEQLLNLLAKHVYAS